MASLIYKPASNTPPRQTEAVEVRFDDEIYTFVPGVPQDVRHEHVAGVTAALQAEGGTVTAGPAEI